MVAELEPVEKLRTLTYLGYVSRLPEESVMVARERCQVHELLAVRLVVQEHQGCTRAFRSVGR